MMARRGQLPTRPRAPALVFLHGAGGHTGWMAFLEELSQRFAVFAPEHPGFGQSDDPPWLDRVGDLAYFYLDLLKALGVHRRFSRFYRRRGVSCRRERWLRRRPAPRYRQRVRPEGTCPRFGRPRHRIARAPTGWRR